MDRQESGGMRIGEVARASGLSTSTIRFYEEAGVLPAARRSRNGYRLYDKLDLARLRFVRNARALEFSTEEVREVLALREQGDAPCQQVLALLEAKVEEAEARIRALEALRDELGALLKAAAPLPTDDVTMEMCVCHLIRSR